MAMSLTKEMAREIARIAQTRIVDDEHVLFKWGPLNLQKVKTTLGFGWILYRSDEEPCQVPSVLLFNTDGSWADDHMMAHTFYINIKAILAKDYEAWAVPGHHINVTFGSTDTVVWRVHCNNLDKEMKVPLQQLVKVLNNPPILVKH